MFKDKKILISAVYLNIFLFTVIPFASAEDNPVVITVDSITVEPGRYVFISNKDDAEKFREDNWIKDKFAGGIRHFTMEGTLLGTEMKAKGHAIIDDNNLGFESSFVKNDIYSLKIGYDEFRHFYDGTGGKFRNFVTLPVELDKELALNIGRFFINTQFPLGDLPDLELSYERGFRQGAKSRLTWGALTEGTVTRRIVPSWQDIDEKSNTFKISAGQEVKGYKLALEQSFEFFEAETFREERTIGGTSAGFVRQRQDPKTRSQSTNLRIERHFNDKLFFSSGYRFSHLNNREFENLNTVDNNGVARMLSGGSKNFFNAYANNTYYTHTLASDFVYGPWKNLTFNTKTKAEYLSKKSASTYPRDTTAISDGIIEDFIDSDTKNNALRFGEGISIRFTGIPRSSVYFETEAEQSRVLLREDRRSSSGDANEIFNRYTVTDVDKFSWTLGSHMHPMKKVDITSQFRQIYNNNDYDDQQESVATGTALSAFVDSQKSRTDEFSTKFKIKLLGWLDNVFKYQFRNKLFLTRFEAQDTAAKTDSISHTYSTDFIITPSDRLSFTGGYSKQQVYTDTPARLNTTLLIPRYKATVDTALASIEYALSEKVSLSSSYQRSWTDNFNDFSAVSLPYGLDNVLQHAELSLRYNLKEGTSVEAIYGYHTYKEKSNAHADDYAANLIALRASTKF